MTSTFIGQKPLEDAPPAASDLQLWSVTTIIGCLDKAALVPWAAQETARAAVLKPLTWQAMADELGPGEAIKWLSKARYRTEPGHRTATELGEAVHDACEQYALTGVRPEVDDEVAPFLNQFDKWLDLFQPEYHAAEMTVYHPDYGYAGTTDAVMTVGGIKCQLDYKTSRKSFDYEGNPTHPYPEAALQLAAYRYAKLAAVWRPRRFERFHRRYYLLGPDEQELAQPVPEVDAGLILHITPEHAVAYPVRCDEAIFECFLYVQEAARWQFEISKDVVGQPLEP